MRSSNGPIAFMATLETDSVEVMFALPDEQTIVEVAIESGMTVAEAVARSGLVERYPMIGGEEPVFGIWGIRVQPDYPVKPGDRIEISRPLRADPRSMRLELVASGKVMGGGQKPET